jgi:hypothetical protein
MTTAIILAGGDISDKLPFLRAGCRCPALIPVNTRPLASYILERYGRDYDVHLFADHRFVPEVHRELSPKKYRFGLHGTDSGRGVVGTLRQALSVLDIADDIIVNVVTTIPTAIPSQGEIQISHWPAHSHAEWSAIDPTGNTLRFFLKGEERTIASLAFTGVFRLPADVLAKAASEAAREDDLLSVVEAASRLATLRPQTVEWIDCGHETNYYKSRATLVNSRSFNSIRVDTKRGTITKSSTDKAKLAAEAAYLDMLPSPLRIIFPRLITKSGNHDSVDAYEMEYYGYPSLAEYLLYWDLSKHNWWRCFDALRDSLTLFRQCPASIGPIRYRDFHWSKTIARITTYLDHLQDESLREHLEHRSIRLNGRRLQPLDSLLVQAERFITASYRETSFGIFHDDFCFNNILFDVVSGLVRLIDPRGSFGPQCPGIYGDWRYDLAKLSHSSIGHYDYLVNGLFEIERPSDGEFSLDIRLRPNSVWLEEMTSWLIAEIGDDPREIKVMTALLFLSMCPLHADDSDRQLGFFLRGLDLLDKAFN